MISDKQLKHQGAQYKFVIRFLSFNMFDKGFFPLISADTFMGR